MIESTQATPRKARHPWRRRISATLKTSLAAGGMAALLTGCVVVPADQGAFYQTAPAGAWSAQGAVVYPDAAYYGAAPGYYYGTTPGYYYGTTPGYYYSPGVSLGVYGSGGWGGYRPSSPRPPVRPGYNRPDLNSPGAGQPSRPVNRRPGVPGITSPGRPEFNRPDAAQPPRPPGAPGISQPDRPRPPDVGSGSGARPRFQPRQDNP